MRVITSRQSDGRIIALVLHGERAWLTLDTEHAVSVADMRAVLWVLRGDDAPNVDEVDYVPREQLHASLLPAEGITLDELIEAPAFVRAAVYAEVQARRWFAERGLCVVSFPASMTDPTALDAYFEQVLIACGPSRDDPHPNFEHAVLWKRGALLHDPKPNGRGLARIENFEVLSVVDLQLAMRSFGR